MSEPSFLPHFSHLRRAPDSVLRGLRQVCPTAELVYLGWRQWQIVEVSANNARSASACRILERSYNTLRLWETVPKFKANPGAFRRIVGRIDFGLLAYDGARFVGGPYKVQGEPTSLIVDDYRQMDYHYRTLTDADVERLLNAPKEQKRALARAEAASENRAADAWRYMFTRSHYNGARPDQQAPPRSGFVRHPSPSTN